MVEVIKSPVPIIVLFDKIYQDAEIFHGLLGKKDPYTTIEKTFDLRCCLMFSDVDFYLICLPHQLSKVVSILGGTETFRVQRRNVNQMQPVVEASKFIFTEGIKFCETGHLFYLREDLLLSVA